MKKDAAVNGNKVDVVVEVDETPEKLHTTDSIYRGIVLACLRSKQLIKGATPRIIQEAKHKNKNTTIAIEEVKQGLVIFEILSDPI